MGSISMTDKEIMNRFLFGGRVTYQGNHYHVLEVNHLKKYLHAGVTAWFRTGN